MGGDQRADQLGSGVGGKHPSGDFEFVPPRTVIPAAGLRADPGGRDVADNDIPVAVDVVVDVERGGLCRAERNAVIRVNDEPVAAFEVQGAVGVGGVCGERRQHK